MDRNLKALTIKHLRGSVEPFTLKFASGKKLTIIYGENGTGKSTICDALEFLANGKVGSIEDRGLGKTPPYWVSLGKDSKDISVELVAGDGVCQAKMNKSSVVVSPTDAAPKTEILRRSQILKLIEASPAKRYEEVKRFIDVSGIDASEKNLSQLIKSSKEDEKIAIALTQESLENIENFYSSAGAKGENAVAWAKAETSRNVSTLEGELNALSALISSYGTLAQRLESIQRATNELNLAEEALSDAEKRLAEVTTDSASGASELLALWKVAHPLLQNHPTAEACPLCESSENAVGLADKVAHKISQLSSLNDALDRKKSGERSLSQSKHKLRAVQETIEKAAQQFGGFCLGKALPEETPLPGEAVPSSASELATWLEKNSSLPEQWNKLESQRQDKKQFLTTLKKSLKSHEANVQQQQELAGALLQQY